MRITNDGRFAVQPGATVTVKTVSTGVNLAAFPPQAVCVNGSSPVTIDDPGNGTRSGSFKAPAEAGITCSVVVLFTFGNSPQDPADDDNYSVTVIETRRDGSTSQIDFGTLTRAMNTGQEFDFLTEAL